jgi:methionyl-tRNA formyltransferase
VRIVLVTQVPPVAQGLSGLLRDLGHEAVALLVAREGASRPGGMFEALVREEIPENLDLVVPATRAGIAPLLRAYAPDLLLCTGFPWRIPPDALAVPRLGAVNGHPSLLPRYRGPIPVAWAIRNGETEIGYTYHRMDAELDTGPVLAQERIPIGDEHTWEELGPKLVDTVGRLLPQALARAEEGDPGDAQPLGEGEYLSFFEPEYVWIDWSRPSQEIYRQIQAWRFGSSEQGERGALAQLDGETVRVLRASLEPADGREMGTGDGKIWLVETEPA